MEEVNLPVNWIALEFAEVIYNANGSRKPVSLKIRATIQGRYPYYGATGQIDSLNDFTHEGEHVLIGEDGANLLSKVKDLAFIVDGKFWVNNHAHAVRCLAGVPAQFVANFINSLDLSPFVTGSAQPKLTKGNLAKIPFPLPPLPEQKIIAEKLDTLLAKVEATKSRLARMPDILKRFRQSVLAHRLGREHNSVHLKLGEIATFQNGYAFKSDWFEPEGIWQVIKLGNIRDGFLATKNAPAYICSSIATEYEKFSPKNGDTLISMTGTRFKKDYGFACLVTGDENVLINQRVGRLIPRTEHVLPEYLNLFVRSEKFREQFFAGETGGVNQGNVGSKHIMNIDIFLPPIAEQTEIVHRVEELFAFADTIEQKASAALARVNKLTQSILAKAFRGELTEQWRLDNPDLITGENSAEALLQKIKAERDRLKPAKKKTAVKRTKK